MSVLTTISTLINVLDTDSALSASWDVDLNSPRRATNIGAVSLICLDVDMGCICRVKSHRDSMTKTPTDVVMFFSAIFACFDAYNIGFAFFVSTKSGG